jgi:hypothetical protein
MASTFAMPMTSAPAIQTSAANAVTSTWMTSTAAFDPDVGYNPHRYGQSISNGFVSEPSHAALYNPMHDPILAALSLPSPNVEPFKGDINQYQIFVNEFETHVGQKPLSDRDKLYFLRQSLQGTPRELISGCFHGAGSDYFEARQILENEYGHPYKLAVVYVKQISAVKNDEIEEIRLFPQEMLYCPQWYRSGAHDLSSIYPD